MRKYDADRFDRLALYTLLVITFMNLIIFPFHKKFLVPADLYTHYPNIIHPFREFFPKSRKLNKLTSGIENSASTLKLPTSGQLFCFVETSEKHYDDRVPSVASTWLSKCDNGRFFTKTPLPDAKMPFSTVYRNLEDSYYDLFRKTLLGFYYSYTYISKDFDWYLKADDDNYYAMDHLKEYLSTLDPSEPLYLGYRLKPFLKDGYNSGGPGYILSNAAVRIFVEYLYNDEELCPYDWAEDRGMGRCLASMGIIPSDTRDKNGAHRFVPFLPKEMLEIPSGYHYYPLNVIEMIYYQLFCVLCYSLLVNSLIQVPLERVESMRSKLMKKGVWKDYQAFQNRIRSLSDAFTGGLIDYETVGYVGKITVGTPQQEFRVIMDTGSSNFWIPDSNCGTDPLSCGRFTSGAATCYGSYCVPGGPNTTASCTTQQKFDSSKSTSYIQFGKSFRFDYGVDDANGLLGYDTVRFGGQSDNQLVVPGTVVGQAVCFPKFFEQTNIDGIMGLGFQANAQQGIVPPFVNAYRNNIVDPLFHVYLEKGPNGAGLITYGGRDTTNCKAVNEYHPLTTYSAYQFYLTLVSAGKYYANKGWTAMADTANSFITGPAGVVAGIADAVGAKWDPYMENYWLPCEPKVAMVNFTIGGTIYPVSAENLIVPYPNKTGYVCIFALLPLSNNGFGPSWVLGDPFHREYCALYDMGNQRMGFSAHAK